MLLNQNLDLTKIDVWNLPCVEHSPIYWNNEDRKPFLEFHEVLPKEIKKKILIFLKNGTCWAASPGILVDDVTGKHLPIQWLDYTDGVYSWDTKTIYQFEHYDMKLPEEFIEHILSQIS